MVAMKCLRAKRLEKRELTAADFGVEEDGSGATGGDAVKDADGKREKKKGNNLFADATVPSFFRRPTFTPDGNLIIAPTGIHRPITIPEILKGESTGEGVQGTPNKSSSSPEVEGARASSVRIFSHGTTLPRPS